MFCSLARCLACGLERVTEVLGALLNSRMPAIQGSQDLTANPGLDSGGALALEHGQNSW